MSTKILFGLSASAILLLSACGDEVTEVTEVNETTGMQVLEKGEALPKCNTDSEGSMVYALDSAAAYVCVDKKWNSLNGKDGEKGDKGDQGEQGVKGDTGEKGDQGEQGAKGDTGEKGDQGEKGDKGDTGSSCTVEQLADSSGYKVICSGDSVGVILNGEKGEKGEQGETGAKGSSCNVFDNGEGTLTIVCNDGKNSRTVEFYKAVCGATPYDPEKMAPAYCDNGILYVKDSRDSQRYRVVPIGSQIWMAENLNYASAESFCYDDDPANCEITGRYYSKDIANNVCPVGWHLPNSEEFENLISYVGGKDVAGMKLKSTNGWVSQSSGNSCNGTDDYGFSIIPSGDILYNANTEKWISRIRGSASAFWINNTGNSSYNVLLIGYIDSYSVSFSTSSMIEYYSIRCLKD